MVIFALSTSAEKSPLLERVALLILILQDAVRSLRMLGPFLSQLIVVHP